MTRAVEPRLLRAASAGRSYLVGTVVFAVATTGLVLVQATLIAEAIARATQGSRLGRIDGVLTALLVVVLARALVTYGAEVAALRAAASIKSTLRRRVVAGGLVLGPAWLTQQRTGELSTLTTRGLDALDPYFARYLPQVALAVLLPVMVLTRLAFADWPSAVIVALTLPLIPVFMALVGWHTRERTERQWRLLSRLGGHFVDVVAGLPTLKVFNRAKAQAQTIRAVTDAHRRQSMAALRIALLSALVLELLATLAMALVAVEIGVRLLEGDLRYETALLVLILTPEAYVPLRQLGAHFHASMEGAGAARQAFDVLDKATATAAATPSARAEVLDAGGPITFDQVTVRYEHRSAPALADVTLTIEPGRTVLLTGPSGAGKTTLLALVLRLVEPTSGRIRVGDTSLADIDPDAWRRRIAWLPQHPHLFAASIADNIALGSRWATPDDIHRAAVAAGAADFVAALPGGYATVLPERGVSLSSGQRQRLALARLLLRDADIVLLDEPTANLDADGAELVSNLIRDRMRRRTVLWVSHDSSVARHADEVVTVRAGRIEPAAIEVA